MSDCGRLELISRTDERNLIERHIREQAASAGTLQILEAGCGQKWRINPDGVKYVLTGVDQDGVALGMRKTIVGDLHVAVAGDLRRVELPERQYDVIYNSFVLEHINGAEQVLGNFARWVKPNGIIVIQIPDPNSVQGFITRVTPHWFHILCHRAFLGTRNAGKAGYGPYPVYYDHVVSRRGMREFCDRNGLVILAEYGDGYVRPGEGAVRLLIHAFKQAVGVLSLGVLSARHTNLLYILRKRQTA